LYYFSYRKAKSAKLSSCVGIVPESWLEWRSLKIEKKLNFDSIFKLINHCIIFLTEKLKMLSSQVLLELSLKVGSHWDI